MPKYRKKPVVIEAFQMTEARRWDNSEWPVWLHMAWNTEPTQPGSLFIDPFDPNKTALKISTLEGDHCVTFGAFIIQGVKGELYPCKPDIFEATYEAVSEAHQ